MEIFLVVFFTTVWALVTLGVGAAAMVVLIKDLGHWLRPSMSFLFSRRFRQLSRLERMMMAVGGLLLGGLAWFFYTLTYATGVYPNLLGEMSRWAIVGGLACFAVRFFWQSVRGTIRVKS